MFLINSPTPTSLAPKTKANAIANKKAPVLMSEIIGII